MQLTLNGGTSPLERYGHNLTLLAQQGALSPLPFQEEVVERVLRVLQGTKKRNPILLDADETRRWATVTQVVHRMTMGDVPERLSGQQVIALDYEALFANLPDDTVIHQKEPTNPILSSPGEMLAQTRTDDPYEAWALLEKWKAPTMVLERLQSMFLAMYQAGDSFVLFVDHLHRLVGGEGERYPINAAPLLKPALARHHIQLIGACTLEQYRLHIERDPALQRLCREMVLFDSFVFHQMGDR